MELNTWKLKIKEETQRNRSSRGNNYRNINEYTAIFIDGVYLYLLSIA